jgi:hypothetical protein
LPTRQRERLVPRAEEATLRGAEAEAVSPEEASEAASDKKEPQIFCNLWLFS